MQTINQYSQYISLLKHLNICETMWLKLDLNKLEQKQIQYLLIQYYGFVCSKFTL